MSPIVWELGLVVGAVVVFWIWQMTTLKRDMRRTQEEKRRGASGEGGSRQDAGERDGGN